MEIDHWNEGQRRVNDSKAEFSGRMANLPWIALGLLVALPIGALTGLYGAITQGVSAALGLATGVLRGVLYFAVLAGWILVIESASLHSGRRVVSCAVAFVCALLVVGPLEFVHDLVLGETPMPAAQHELWAGLVNKTWRFSLPYLMFCAAVLVPRLALWWGERRMPAAGSPVAEPATVAVPQAPPQSIAEELGAELPSDVMLAEAQEHYVVMHMRSARRVIVHARFSDTLQLLEAERGIQVHRSFWVADDAVQALASGRTGLRLALSIGRDVPVSRSFAKQATGRYADRSVDASMAPEPGAP